MRNIQNFRNVLLHIKKKSKPLYNLIAGSEFSQYKWIVECINGQIYIKLDGHFYYVSVFQFNILYFYLKESACMLGMMFCRGLMGYIKTSMLLMWMMCVLSMWANLLLLRMGLLLLLRMGGFCPCWIIRSLHCSSGSPENFSDPWWTWERS